MIIRPRIAGKSLELNILQHRYEIKSSVKVKKYLNWTISSRASNRGRFNDYPVAWSRIKNPKYGLPKSLINDMVKI